MLDHLRPKRQILALGLVSAFVIPLICSVPLISQEWQQRSAETYGVGTKLVWLQPNTLVMSDRGSVRVSSDGGVAWTETTTSWGSTVGQLTSYNDTLYLIAPVTSGAGTYGLWVSVDKGATFQLRGSQQLTGAAFTHVVASGTRIAIGTNRAGLFSSYDGGHTFANIAVPAAVGTVVDAHASGSRWIVAGGTGGAAWTPDDGATWNSIQQPAAGVIGAPQVVRCVGERMVIASNFGAFVVSANSQTVVTTGLPSGSGLPGIIQDMQVLGNEVFAVVTPFGGRTMVYVLPAGSTQWQRLGTADWDNRHGAARGMICPTPSGVFLHHVLTTTREGATWFFQRNAQTSVPRNAGDERNVQLSVLVDGNQARIVGNDEASFEEIVGLSGQRYVLQCQTSSCSSINVSSLPTAMFFARVRSTGHSTTVPFIIAR